MHDAHDAGPVKFKLGEHKVIAGMEEAVLNMRVGEKKTTQFQPDAARFS
jgi:FKBP-type peptidyl-prolyl cis-trans isomerase 2